MSTNHDRSYDLFISYAHVNNKVRPGAEKGWVTTLKRDLENLVATKLGREDTFSFWWDKSHLRGHHAVTPEIREALERSSNLLIVLSTGYLRSEWCLEEKKIFFDRSDANTRNRVFVVELDNLERETPEIVDLSDINRYRFWYKDDSERVRMLSIQDLEPQKTHYVRKVEDLASDISGLIDADSNEPAATVFLAEATDDMDRRCDQVRRYLKTANIRVLPSRRYLEGAEFRKMLEEDMAKSELFIQLLGKYPGKRPPDIPKGYVHYQWEHARAHEIPVFQWRDPDLSIENVDSDTMGNLLLSDSVYAETLESFKSRVLHRVLNPEPPLKKPGPPAPAPVVFINYERRDQAIARGIRECVPEQLLTTFPAVEGNAAHIRKDLEEKLLKCDALIVVYGDGTLSWVDKQLLHFNRIISDRAQGLNALGVYDGPPEKKPDVMTKMPGLEILPCRQAVDCTRVKAFLEPLL